MPDQLKFQSSYLKANPRQKQAIDHVYEPALILAGAGTGKTQVLTLRATRLMQSDIQVSPDNILQLTYTDAGSKAMRNRLVQFIGPAAYRVTINTFHSFCSDIIKYNMDYFGFRDLEAIDELENIRVIYQIINKLPADNPLRRIKGDPYFEVYRMKNFFTMMKEEGWDYGSVKAACKRWVDSLENGEVEDFVYKRKYKEYAAGDIKVDKVEAEKTNCGLLIGAASLFEGYQAELKRLNRYDFSDMIHWVIDAFRSSNGEWLLQQYQEKYQQIMVDEYQDTNGPQQELLDLLMGYWDKPNLFVVGDDQQCLYSFQGARIQNIMDFVSKYKPTIITLNENYRSTQGILDNAMSVINNNQVRLAGRIEVGDYSGLKSQLKENSQPVCYEYKNILEEESSVVDSIRELVDAGVVPDSIAVLYRKHRQAENIIKMLSSMDIPVNARKRVDVLQQPIIKQLINILRYAVDNNGDRDDRDDLLFEILHYPYFKMNHTIIMRFIKQHNNEPRIYLENVEALHSMGHTQSIPEFISSAMTETGMLKYVAEHSQSRELLVYLTTFMEFAKAYCFKNPHAKMLDMLQDIDKMIDRDVQLTCQDIYVGEKGVTFSTVHGAKGMEWDKVFLIGCTSNEWEKSRGRNDSYRLPPTISKSEGDDDLEAARRLFYVAITRAKTALTISYVSHNNDGKDLEVTRFVPEAGLEPVPQNMNANSSRFYDRLYNLLNKTQPVLTIKDRSYLAELVDGYVLSASAVNKFLTCPLTWYFENLIRVPFVATGALIFGNAFHYAMKKYYDEAKNKYPGPEQVLNWFYEDMTRHKGQISSDEWMRRMELGTKLVPKYYEDIISGSNKITLNEYKIRNVTLENGVPFKGDIDKMEFNGNLVSLVDYKTGSYKYVKNDLKPAGDDFIGGGIWRQLITYALLVGALKSKPWQVNSLRVEFIGEEELGPIPVERFEGDGKIVLNQIKTVYDRIQALDFLTGCGDSECRWCQFVKEDI
jgi:DNA helicase-2/ATP-dependent DNA helicase PcrA